MIYDQELDNLLHQAANSIDVPTDGPQRIEAQLLSQPGDRRRTRWSFRRRDYVLAATSFAAVITLVVVLLTTGNSTSPAVNFAAAGHAASAPTASPNLQQPRSATANRTADSAGRALGRDIVTTGTLDLNVSSVKLATSVNDLESLATSLGGFVGHMAITETGGRRGGTIVVDVPASSFATLVTKVRAVGTVHSLSTADEDVTSQVVDLGAQLTALVDERTQLETLLAKAGKVSDLLAVEDQIEAVQSQIQTIQGEQRELSQQIAYSALTVNVALVGVPQRASNSGFAHAWHQAVSGFVDGIKGVVAHLGDVLFVFLAVLIGLTVLYVLWRRLWPIIVRHLA